MKHTITNLFIAGLITSILPKVSAGGCVCIPGGFTIQSGTFSYDSVQGAYMFALGDTLRVTYHAYDGGGSDYMENYYQGDTLLIGQLGDTLLITEPGTYQAKIGCFTEMYTTEIRFANSGLNSIKEDAQTPLIKAYSQRNQLILSPGTTTVEQFPYQLQVYDVSGRLLLEQDKLYSSTTYTFPLLYDGLKLLRISYVLNGQPATKTIKIF